MKIEKEPVTGMMRKDKIQFEGIRSFEGDDQESRVGGQMGMRGSAVGGRRGWDASEPGGHLLSLCVSWAAERD